MDYTQDSWAESTLCTLRTVGEGGVTIHVKK